MTNYDSNKLMIQMQCSALWSKPSNELTKSHYKLFTVEHKQFVIAITTFTSDKMWFTTYYLNSDGTQTDIVKHKVFGKSITAIIDTIFMQLTSSEIELADNILFRQIVKPKAVVKTKLIINDSEPRRKRSTDIVKPEAITHLRPCTNAAERKSAELERKMFKNPKLWEFEL